MPEKKVRITIPAARLSYPSLFKPRPEDGFDAGKYTATLIVPKEDEKSLEPLRTAIRTVIQDTWGSKVPKNLFFPIHDGDEDDDLNTAGCWFVRVKTTIKPRCYRASGGAYIVVEDSNVFYPGCWVAANVHPYPYGPGVSKSKIGNAGISISLNSVCFLRDDDPFVSYGDPVDDFGPPPESSGSMEEIPF
jgi:hypothetical protein